MKCVRDDRNNNCSWGCGLGSSFVLWGVDSLFDALLGIGRLAARSTTTSLWMNLFDDIYTIFPVGHPEHTDGNEGRARCSHHHIPPARHPCTVLFRYLHKVEAAERWNWLAYDGAVVAYSGLFSFFFADPVFS